MAGGRIKYIDGPGGSDPAWRVDIALGPSRRVAAYATALGAAALACVLGSDLSRELAAPAGMAVVAAAVGAIRREAFREGRGAVRRVAADLSGRVTVQPALGPPLDGRWLPGCFVAPWLVVLRWRPEGSRFARTVLLPPDAVEAEAFRRLRVLLRWGGPGRAGRAGTV